MVNRVFQTAFTLRRYMGKIETLDRAVWVGTSEQACHYYRGLEKGKSKRQYLGNLQKGKREKKS